MHEKKILKSVCKHVFLASDHAGFLLKQDLISFLRENSLEPIDLGAFDQTSVDYPDFAFGLAQKLKDDAQNMGVLICGTGQGMAIAANRFSHIRAAVVWSSEIARLARAHNNANVLCLGGRLWTKDQAIEFLRMFLTTPFDGGRHMARIQKLSEEGS